MPRLGLGRNLLITRRTGDAKTGAHYFNGTTTRIQLTNAMSLQDFTIMFWAKPVFASSGRIIDFRDTTDDGVCITNNTSSNVRSSYNTVLINSTITNNTWQHIAYTANTTSDLITPFLNGVAGTTASISGINNSVSTAGKIGCRNFGGVTEFYKGYLAQMAVFNTALSDVQITAIMNKTYGQLTAGEKTNLVSWWALTNISGTSVPDLHGTNTGTLTP